MASRVISVILTANSASLRTQLALAAREVESFGGKVSTSSGRIASSSSLMLKAVGTGAVLVGVALAASVEEAAKFEVAMRNVNTIAGMSEQSLKATGKAVLDLSKRLPQSAVDLAKGLYDIASSGFEGADALNILEESAKAASAGLTTTAVAAKGIVSVLNAYGLSAEHATDVSDIMFQTVNLGIITFEELASQLGDVVGAASLLGVEFAEVGSALAAITLSGISAAEASTSLNRVLRTLIKPGAALKEVLAGMNFESGIAAVKSLGLRGTIEALSKAVGNNASSWVALFPEMRAFRGAAALAANEGENYARTAKAIEIANNRAGATQNALNQQMKAASFQFKLFINDLRVSAIELGTKLLPVLVRVMHASQEFGHALGTIVGNALKALMPLFEQYRNYIATLAGALVKAGQEMGPFAEAMAKLGGGAAIGSLKAILSVATSLAKILGEHPAIIQAVAAAYGLVLARNVIAAASAFAILRAEAAAGPLIGLAGSARSAAQSLLTLKGAATAGAFTVAVAGIVAYINALDKAKKAGKAAVDAIAKKNDTTTWDGAQAAITATQARLKELDDQFGFSHASWQRGLRGVIEVFSPLKNKVLDAKAEFDALSLSVEAIKANNLANISTSLSYLNFITGMTTEQILSVARVLDVDLSKALKDNGKGLAAIVKYWRDLQKEPTKAAAVLALGAKIGLEAVMELEDEMQKAGEVASKAFLRDFGVSALVDVVKDHARAVEDAARAQERYDDVLDASAEKNANAKDRVVTANEKVNESREHEAEVAVASAEKIKDAQTRIAESAEAVSEARLHETEVAEKSAADIAEANQGVADAVAEAADNEQDAYRKVEDARRKFSDSIVTLSEREAAAEERLSDAHKRELDAQESLNDARRQAVEDLDDLRRSAEGADISEERAVLRLAKARDEEGELILSGTASARELAEARLDVRDAELTLAEATDRKLDQERELREAEAAGVNGSERVRDAEDKLTKARKDAFDAQVALNKERIEGLQRVADAEQDMIDAQNELVKVQIAGAKEIAQAQADAKKAQVDAAKEIADAHKGVIKSQEDLKKSQEDLKKVQIDAAKDVRDAHKATTDAQKESNQAVIDQNKVMADTQKENAKAAGELAVALKAVADTDITNFFINSRAEMNEFISDIQKVVAKGLSPTFVKELLEAGPKAAGPVLKEILNDTSGNLIDQYNEFSKTLDDVNTQIIMAARIAHRAINAENDDIAADYGVAMQILAAKGRLGGKATADAVAAELGIGADKVRQVATDYVIVLTDKTAEAKTNVSVNMQEMMDGVVSAVTNGTQGTYGPFQEMKEALASQALATQNSVVGTTNNMSTDMIAAVDRGVRESDQKYVWFGKATGKNITDTKVTVLDQTNLLSGGMITNMFRGINATAPAVRSWSIDVQYNVAAVLGSLISPEALERAKQSSGNIMAGITVREKGGFLPSDPTFQPAGTLVQWAEPRTKGEYFFPVSKGKDNIPLANEMLARWGFGVAKEEFAYGGQRGGKDERGYPYPIRVDRSMWTWSAAEGATEGGYGAVRAWDAQMVKKAGGGLLMPSRHAGRVVDMPGGNGGGFADLRRYVHNSVTNALTVALSIDARGAQDPFATRRQIEAAVPRIVEAIRKFGAVNSGTGIT